MYKGNSGGPGGCGGEYLGLDVYGIVRKAMQSWCKLFTVGSWFTC